MLTLAQFCDDYKLKYNTVYRHAREGSVPIRPITLASRTGTNRAWAIEEKDLPQVLKFFGLTEADKICKP